MNTDQTLENILKVVKQVHKIYQEHGQKGPPIRCPWCKKETTGYGCSWGYNNHVHFKCEHCGQGFMQ